MKYLIVNDQNVPEVSAKVSVGKVIGVSEVLHKLELNDVGLFFGCIDNCSIDLSKYTVGSSHPNDKGVPVVTSENVEDAFEEIIKFYSNIEENDKELAWAKEVAQQGSMTPEEKEKIQKIKNMVGGKIIKVTSPKGGTGKTSCSLSLTYTLTQRVDAIRGGCKILVVDSDLQDSQLGLIFGVLTDAYWGEDDFYGKKAIDDYIIQVRNDNVSYDVLPASIEPGNYHKQARMQFLDMLELVKDRYDYIIIDSSIRFFESHEVITNEVCDHLVLITDLSVAGLYRTAVMINGILTEKGVTKATIYGSKTREELTVVVNNYHNDAAIKLKSIEAAVRGVNIKTISNGYEVMMYCNMLGDFSRLEQDLTVYTDYEQLAAHIDEATQ